MICCICLFWLSAHWFLASVISVTLTLSLACTNWLIILRYSRNVGIRYLRLRNFLGFIFYDQYLTYIFVLFFTSIYYQSGFYVLLVLNWIGGNRFYFLFDYNKFTFLLLFFIFLKRALYRSLIINRNSVKRRRIFFSMVIFIMFRFSFFLIELCLPLLVNELMIVSEISKGLFEFALKYFITELIFLHLHHFIKLPF